MRIVEQWAFPGPNVHLARPALECLVDLEDAAGVDTRQAPHVTQTLLALLPGLKDHHCGLGYPGGFTERLREGTFLGHVVEHVALELLCLAGQHVRYGKTRSAGREGLYRIVVEMQTQASAQAAMGAALAVVEDVWRGRDPLLAQRQERVREAHLRTAMGPTTRALWEEALRRGIPVRRLDEETSLLEMGYGIHRRRVQASLTDLDTSVAVDLAQDKVRTAQLLEEAGLPTPEILPVSHAHEVQAALAQWGGPVVVKPREGRQGQSVHMDLCHPQAVAKAVRQVQEEAGEAIVQRQVEGVPVRVLVVGGRAVAAARRLAAHVVGDGKTTVAELIQRENSRPERGEGHAQVLTRLDPDHPEARRLLREQGLTLGAVAAPGQVVWLRRSANLSTGGEAHDITGKLHPDNAHLAERAAMAVGLEVAGVDLILPDPFRSHREVGGWVLEVNAAPGLRMHLAPSHGRPRDVARAVVARLFPPPMDGRIPIAAITGTNGKTTVARLVAHAVGLTGKVVGLATTDGIQVAGRWAGDGDCAGARSARQVLSDPRVEVAVLECARGGLRRRGLGFDRCTVGTVLNVGPDHLGQDGVQTLEDLAHIKSLVAERVLPQGVAVLNALDPRVLAMAKRTPATVVLFSLDPHAPAVKEHLSQGGEAVCLWQGQVALGRRDGWQPLVSVRRLPFAFGGASLAMVDNALAAAATCLGLGLTPNQVARGLVTFGTLPSHNPGRLSLQRVAGRQVLLDYGHNAPALRAVGQLARRLARGRLLGVICAPGDRRDEDIRALGEEAGRIFWAVWIKEDVDLRGRAPGETAGLLRQGALQGGCTPSRVHISADEAQAVTSALWVAGPEDLVVVLYETLDHAQASLDQASSTLENHWRAQG